MQLTFDIPEDLKRGLEEEAEKQLTSVSAVSRLAIKEFLERKNAKRK